MNDQPLAVADGEHGDVGPSRRRDLGVPEQIAVESPRLREIARLQRDVRDADDGRARGLNDCCLRASDGERCAHQRGKPDGFTQKSPQNIEGAPAAHAEATVCNDSAGILDDYALPVRLTKAAARRVERRSIRYDCGIGRCRHAPASVSAPC